VNNECKLAASIASRGGSGSSPSQIFIMRFVKPSSTTPVIVKGREGNADVANKACLRSNLAKEWGDVSTVCSGRVSR
jgi:hypothetical protein